MSMDMISTTQQACIDTINPEHPNHGPHCGGPSAYVDNDLIGTLTPYFSFFFLSCVCRPLIGQRFSVVYIVHNLIRCVLNYKKIYYDTYPLYLLNKLSLPLRRPSATNIQNSELDSQMRSF